MQVLAQPTYNMSSTAFSMRPLLPQMSPDNNAIFNFRAQTSMPQEENQKTIIKYGDFGEPLDIIRKGYKRFLVSLTFDFIHEDKLAAITEFYYNPIKGAEGLKSFLWEHPTELNSGGSAPQKYVVKMAIANKIAVTHFAHERKSIKNINFIVFGWSN